MRFALQTLVILILASVLELFLPWWSIALAAFIGGLVFRTNANFFAGFLGVAALWVLMALVIDTSSATDLTRRVAGIFMGIPVWGLYAVTALIGGLVGGLAATTGASLRKPKKRLRYQ